MIRAPSYLDNNTRTCPGFGKTQAQQAVAIEVYRTPWWKRAVWAFCKHGWVLVLAAAFVFSFLLTGCADEAQTYAADQASLADAIAQASKEAGK